MTDQNESDQTEWTGRDPEAGQAQQSADSAPYDQTSTGESSPEQWPGSSDEQTVVTPAAPSSEPRSEPQAEQPDPWAGWQQPTQSDWQPVGEDAPSEPQPQDDPQGQADPEWQADPQWQADQQQAASVPPPWPSEQQAGQWQGQPAEQWPTDPQAQPAWQAAQQQQQWPSEQPAPADYPQADYPQQSWPQQDYPQQDYPQQDWQQQDWQQAGQQPWGGWPQGAQPVPAGAPSSRTSSWSTVEMLRALAQIASPVLILIGLSVKQHGAYGWKEYTAWAIFAAVCALLQLVPLLRHSFELSDEHAWWAAAAGAAGLVLYWVVIVLPSASTSTGFAQTLGVAAAVVAVWLTPGRKR